MESFCWKKEKNLLASQPDRHLTIFFAYFYFYMLCIFILVTLVAFIFYFHFRCRFFIFRFLFGFGSKVEITAYFEMHQCTIFCLIVSMNISCFMGGRTHIETCTVILRIYSSYNILLTETYRTLA